MDPSKFEFTPRKFDFTSFLSKYPVRGYPSSNVYMILGGKRTGKTTLVKDILHNLGELPRGTVVSSSLEYTPDIPKSIVDKQKQIAAKFLKEIGEHGTCDIDTRNLLVLDDCLTDPSWIKDMSIRNLFMNGRCMTTTLIIALQDSKTIPLSLCGNVDLCFIFGETKESQRRELFKKCAGMFPSFDAFCQVLDQCTSDFECLVIDNTVHSDKLEDKVFWHKVSLADPFVIPPFYPAKILDEPRSLIGIRSTGCGFRG